MQWVQLPWSFPSSYCKCLLLWQVSFAVESRSPSAIASSTSSSSISWNVTPVWLEQGGKRYAQQYIIFNSIDWFLYDPQRPLRLSQHSVHMEPWPYKCLYLIQSLDHEITALDVSIWSPGISHFVCDRASVYGDHMKPYDKRVHDFFYFVFIL